MAYVRRLLGIAPNMRLKSKTALINIIRSERRGSSAPSVLLGEPVAWMTKDGRISTLDTMDGKQTAKSGPAYFGDHWCIPLYANTKAVSIDRIMEVVGQWIEASEDSGTIITLPLLPEEWEPLRERLSKL